MAGPRLVSQGLGCSGVHRKNDGDDSKPSTPSLTYLAYLTYLTYLTSTASLRATEERCVSAGYDNGDIKLFDLRTNTLRYETNVANGVTGVEFDRRDIEMNKFAVTTLESKFRVYDARTQHPTEGLAYLSEKAHKSTVWLARHLPQNRDLFMTGGGNGGFNVYKYSYPSARTTTAKDNHPMGVAGSVELLNSRVISVSY